jgi:hypothetical protein
MHPGAAAEAARRQRQAASEAGRAGGERGRRDPGALLVVPGWALWYSIIMKEMDKSVAAVLAKAIAAVCVRNGFLEDLHSGTTPSSKTGDYSDVKVVTPYGSIPWRDVSRISDEEMKRLMKGIVDQIYTFLSRQEDPAFLEAFLRMGSMYAARWDEPKLTQDPAV